MMGGLAYAPVCYVMTRCFQHGDSMGLEKRTKLRYYARKQRWELVVCEEHQC